MGSTNTSALTIESKPVAFLGGTCNGSTWRESLIPLLNINYFDPNLPPDQWNDAAYEKELKARAESDFVVYALTPKMEGVYSVAEVVDDSNKRPTKTVILVLEEDEGQTFTEHQLKALGKVQKMVVANGGKSVNSLAELAELLNS